MASRCAVGRASPVACDQRGEAGRAGLERAEDDRGLVQNADSARVVHVPILPSHMRDASTSRTEERRWAGRWPRRSGTRTSCARAEGEPDLLYIDLHLVHEVTSPQAFDGLRLAGRPVRRPDLTLATEDHNVPTIDIDQPIADPVSRTQVETLRRNCAEFGVPLHSARRRRAGHRARRRPAARPDPAGHDRRLRRLAHLDPRRVRRARLRHRHQRGRARAGHPDAAAASRSRRWRSPSTATLPAGRHRQGPDPRGDRPRSAPAAARATSSSTAARRSARCRWRRRMTICNMSIEAGARAGHDRAGRDDLRLPRRAGRTRRRAPTGTRRSTYWRDAAHRRRRGLRRARSSSTPAALDAVRHLGHQPRPGRCR